MSKIHIPTPLRQYVGKQATVEVPGGTVGEAMSALVAQLNEQLGPVLDDEPYVFYGHSMGALVAYELARLRWEYGLRLPNRLLLGACPAPERTPREGVLSGLPDSALIALLQDGAITSEVLLSRPDWLRWGLALLRNDLRLCDSGEPGPVDRPLLPIPLVVFGGLSDPLVSRADLTPWAGHTSVGCRTLWVPGGHFFPRESGPAFFARLSAVLEDA